MCVIQLLRRRSKCRVHPSLDPAGKLLKLTLLLTVDDIVNQQYMLPSTVVPLTLVSQLQQLLDAHPWRDMYKRICPDLEDDTFTWRQVTGDYQKIYIQLCGRSKKNVSSNVSSMFDSGLVWDYFFPSGIVLPGVLRSRNRMYSVRLMFQDLNID